MAQDTKMNIWKSTLILSSLPLLLLLLYRAKKKANQIFLETNRKKKLVSKDGSCSVVLYPRSLYFVWGENSEYWSWKIGEDNIEVAELVNVCWLDVQGKLGMSELSPGVTYEVAYKVKLTTSASGWEVPINLRLSLPGETTIETEISLLDKVEEEWFELGLGNFEVQPDQEGEVGFDLFEHGDHWKSGLVIKEFIIRPVQY